MSKKDEFLIDINNQLLFQNEWRLPTIQEESSSNIFKSSVSKINQSDQYLISYSSYSGPSKHKLYNIFDDKNWKIPEYDEFSLYWKIPNQNNTPRFILYLENEISHQKMSQADQCNQCLQTGIQ